MIGKIYKARTPYFDLKTNQVQFKSRPALIIAQADPDDYIVLPISKISRFENRNPIYDIEINPERYPNTNLKAISYVRTHKQTVIHKSDLNGCICNLKTNYEDLYIEIINNRDKFSREITKQAL